METTTTSTETRGLFRQLTPMETVELRMRFLRARLHATSTAAECAPLEQ